eukprot:scaffold95812_cov14-Tisochrysis_lutea.AAC.1
METQKTAALQKQLAQLERGDAAIADHTISHVMECHEICKWHQWKQAPMSALLTNADVCLRLQFRWGEDARGNQVGGCFTHQYQTQVFASVKQLHCAQNTTVLIPIQAWLPAAQLRRVHPQTGRLDPNLKLEKQS